MALTPRSLALLLALGTTLALAGCISSSEDPVAPQDTGADAALPAANATTKTVTLYEFNDLVTGVSAPVAKDNGITQLPLAKSETFTVPEGTLNLTFASERPTGTGNARIEVYNPDGEVVYTSDTVIYAGVPGVAGGGVYNPTEGRGDGAIVPGDYEVRYYVAGAVQAILTVEGITPA